MSILKVAGLRNSIRKMFLLPVGATVIAIGIAWSVYFWYPTMKAREVADARREETIELAGKALAESDDIPRTVKERLEQCALDLQRGDTAAILPRLAELSANPSSYKYNRNIDLAIKSLKDAVHAANAQSSDFLMLLIGAGVIALGIGLVGYSFYQSVRCGVNVTAEQMAQHLNKFYAPELSPEVKEEMRQKGIKNVTVQVTVNHMGFATDIEVLDGPPTLIPQLLRAARKWRFDPFLLKGRAVPVVGEMKITLKTS